jgi:PAS domain S-box-containing protein
MQMSAEGLSIEGLSALRLIERKLPLLEDEGIAEALVWIPEVYGAGHYSLVALDREGVAHPLAGTLPSEEIGPPLLEALESASLGEKARSGITYGSRQLGRMLVSWPRESGLAGRFLGDATDRLGILLLRDVTGPSGKTLERAQPAALGDHLLTLLLKHWRLGREQRWLGEFTRALIGAQRRGVLAIDRQGSVIYLNRSGAEILGIDAERAVGSDCTRVLRPAVGEDHPLLQGLAGKVARTEIYVTDHRGRGLSLSLRMRCMEGAAGETAGLVCLFRDPSQERAFDQEARRRERLAVIGELAAGVAHEIRNPLTGIGNCAQVLQERLSEDEANRKMADLILREAQRLDRIVTSLLKFAHPGPPRMRETRIEEVVRAALDIEQATREKAGVRCEMRVSGKIPAIHTDPEQIQQVLVNLARNAIQAMPDGGVLGVEVEVVRRPLHMRRGPGRRSTDRGVRPPEDPLARFVRIRISDTGKGIPEDVLPRIFDPFFTTRSGGTGLGLSVSQSIIQEHGGSISVQSGPGKGTIFEVDLPVERRHGERRKEARP